MRTNSRLVNMSDQHRNQASIARETLSIFHPDICAVAGEERRVEGENRRQVYSLVE